MNGLLEQREQAMRQLYLSDKNTIAYLGVTYIICLKVHRFILLHLLKLMIQEKNVQKRNFFFWENSKFTLLGYIITI